MHKAGHTPEAIGEHLASYLAANKPEFVKLEKFAETFAQWDPQRPASWVADMKANPYVT